MSRQGVLKTGTGWQAKLPSMLSALISAGTSGYPASQRSNLIATNVTGYLASLSSLTYAINYSLQDFQMLKPLVIGNIVSAVITASMPLLHRFGSVVGGLVLSITLFLSMFYFTALLGHDTGIQLNYLGTAAIAFLVLGPQRIYLVVAIIVTAALFHLAAWFMFPPDKAQLQLPVPFISQIYSFSAISIMAIITVVVYYTFRLLRMEQDRSDALLLNIMPQAIADRLKADPDATIAERHDQATVLFADITGFTPLASKLGPQQIVQLLDEIFSAFDAHTARLGIEKIKTIGDAYMVVSGAPHARADHAEAAARLASAMLVSTENVARQSGHDLKIRIGIASGPVMAGVIGRTKFAYDVWGETVNRAARLEANSEPGCILIDEACASQLNGEFVTSQWQDIDLKGIGPTRTARLTQSTGKRPT